MKAGYTTGIVNRMRRSFGMSRRAVLMLVVLLACSVASAQAREPEFASILRPNVIAGVPTSLSALNVSSDESAPVNIRKEIGIFFDEPNEGVLKLPFNLSGKSDVSVVVTTLDGKPAYSLERQDVAAGQLQLVIDLRAAGLTDGEYLVQIGLSRSESSAHYAQTVALR